MTDGRSRTGAGRLTKGEVQAIVAAASRPLHERIAQLEKRGPVRRDQASIDAVAAMIVKLDTRIAAQEVRAGLREAMPVRKRGASVAEQLREIAEDRTVRKSRWSGVL